MESESFGLIRVDEVVEALDAGEIIEEYPDDQPYPSCLILVEHEQQGRSILFALLS